MFKTGEQTAISRRIKSNGKRFAIMNTLWVPGSPSDFFLTPVSPKYNPSERFKTDENKKQGFLRELLEHCLPADLRTKLREKYVIGDVSSIVYVDSGL